MPADTFNFQPFLAIGGSYAQKLSIRSNGSLGLSQGLMHRYGLTQGDWYACLFYDTEKRAIGIKFLQDGGAPGAVKVHARSSPGKNEQKSWSGHIAARAFLDYYSIDYRKTSRASFRPEWNESFGGIVVLLGDPTGEDEVEDF